MDLTEEVELTLRLATILVGWRQIASGIAASVHLAEMNAVIEELQVLEDILEQPRKKRKHRGQNLHREAYSFGDWTDPRNNRSFEFPGITHNQEAFKAKMRLSKPLFDLICKKVLERLAAQGKNVIKDVVERRIAVLIRYLAENDSLGTIGDFFGIAKETVSSDLRYGVQYILETFQSGENKIIKFPVGEQLRQVTEWFQEKSYIPNVVGAIDCSYIHIKKPTKRRYRNSVNGFYGRKGFGILLQAVVGPDRCFYDVDIRMPAAAGDWNTYKKSKLYTKLNSHDKRPYPEGMHLLADAGYYADPHLLVPFSRKAGYSYEELNFNYCHSKARVVVEDAFGILKMRWRRFNHFDIREDVDFVPLLVKAACVLHNICRQNADFVNDGAIFGHDFPAHYEPEDVLVWAMRHPEPGQRLNRQGEEPNAGRLAVVFNADHLVAQRVGGADRMATIRVHDVKRAAIMNELPPLLTNRQQVLNPANYHGDNILDVDERQIM